MVLDLKANTEEAYRVRTCVFPQDERHYVNVSKQKLAYDQSVVIWETNFDMPTRVKEFVIELYLQLHTVSTMYFNMLYLGVNIHNVCFVKEFFATALNGG